jgi:capsular polysaccharide biosynthesis protein
MDNSEVDLYPTIKTIWDKKKSVLLYTVFIVIGSVLFSYSQPKYYETQIEAYVLQSKDDIYTMQKVWPAEYYEKFSKSPEILKAVLKNLPKDIIFNSDITPLNYLSSILRVKSKLIHAQANFTSSAIQLTYSVRHPDPSYAHKIAKTWKDVLTINSSQFEKEELIDKYHEKEKELKANFINWNEAKIKLNEFNKSFDLNTQTLKLQSEKRLISNFYNAAEKLKKQLDPELIFIDTVTKRNLNEEKYRRTKSALNEYKRLLVHQSLTSKVPSARSKNNDILNPGHLSILNPIYLNLQNNVLNNEVLLKTLKTESDRLNQMIVNLKSGPQIFKGEDVNKEAANRKYHLNSLNDKIELHEDKARFLNAQISEQIIKHKSLTHKEVSAANLYNSRLNKFKELELFKNAKSRPLDFSLSTLEPPIFLGTPMQRIIFTAFACGLFFSILVILIRENFRGKFEARSNSREREKQYKLTTHEDSHPAYEESNLSGNKKIPPTDSLASLKEPKTEYSPTLINSGLTEGH